MYFSAKDHSGCLRDTPLSLVRSGRLDRPDRLEIFDQSENPGLENIEVVLENIEDLALHSEGSLEVNIIANVELLAFVLPDSLSVSLVKREHHAAQSDDVRNKRVDDGRLGLDELKMFLREDLQLLEIFRYVQIVRAHRDAAPVPGELPTIVETDAIEEEIAMHVKDN
ncbi:unnamed protein product [Clonostachys solani]|uniref:Uncharacterized protein n=1 Tax=Clonostachys solani TaxID=160281 RepID=A0A9N9YZM5_9HYPO|nr:unnamed protein product [Clonostachys solani]